MVSVACMYILFSSEGSQLPFSKPCTSGIPRIFKDFLIVSFKVNILRLENNAVHLFCNHFLFCYIFPAPLSWLMPVPCPKPPPVILNAPRSFYLYKTPTPQHEISAHAVTHICALSFHIPVQELSLILY